MPEVYFLYAGTSNKQQEQVTCPCIIAIKVLITKQTEIFFSPYPVVFLHEVPAELQMVLQWPNEVHRILLVYRALSIPSSVKLLQRPRLRVQTQNKKGVDITYQKARCELKKWNRIGLNTSCCSRR